jgi:hypothetical protein
MSQLFNARNRTLCLRARHVNISRYSIREHQVTGRFSPRLNVENPILALTWDSMRQNRQIGPLLLITLIAIIPLISARTVPVAQAENNFTLTPFPAFTQEGNTISLVLTVSNANSSTTYRFVFSVKDPANKTATSALQTYTTQPGQNQFSILVNYPSPTFVGSNSLVGLYTAQADEVASVIQTTVAVTHFIISVADNVGYERTQTVNMHATGYAPSESVSISIVTKSTLTTVFSQTTIASTSGLVSSSWRIPVNATIDTYLLSLTGTSTVKSPADAQPFAVKQAVMTVAAIAPFQPTYERTDTMQFSFQPTYPDGSSASTGVALLTLARPDGRNITFTATYDNASQSFETSYQTFPDNQTGAWTASLAAFGFSDSYGNSGPSRPVTTAAQLNTAVLTVNVATATSFRVGEQMRFNASITYPDGTVLDSGRVGAYLLLSGGQATNESVPMVFDTNLRVWVGTYTWPSSDPGGLWSLTVKASDTFSSPNSGSATRAVILDNAAGGSASFPLFYFGIAAALIAIGLVGSLFFFRRRRKGTSTSLKIDLEAVKSEAGRIGDQDFFQSIRDQVRKDKDD